MRQMLKRISEEKKKNGECARARHRFEVEININFEFLTRFDSFWFPLVQCIESLVFVMLPIALPLPIFFLLRLVCDATRIRNQKTSPPNIIMDMIFGITAHTLSKWFWHTEITETATAHCSKQQKPTDQSIRFILSTVMNASSHQFITKFKRRNWIFFFSVNYLALCFFIFSDTASAFRVSAVLSTYWSICVGFCLQLLDAPFNLLWLSMAHWLNLKIRQLDISHQLLHIKR